MAFVGSLFSCGRSRKPQIRDETLTGADATRRQVTSDPASGGDIRATPNGGPDDSHVKTPPLLSGRATPAPFPDEEDDEVEPSSAKGKKPNDITSTFCAPSDVDAIRASRDASLEAPRSRDGRSDDSSDDNVKGGKIWQIEQRILITTRPSTSNSASARKATPEPGLDDVSPISPNVTSRLGVQETTPPRQSIESDVSAMTEEVQPEVAQYAAPLSQSPRESLATKGKNLDDTGAPVVVQHSAPESENQKDNEMASKASSSRDIVTSAGSLNEERTEAGVLPVAAPTPLLDLPAEIRKAIYAQMIEASSIRMCRHDDPALMSSGNEPIYAPKRQYYALTQVCRTIRKEFLPTYELQTSYILDLWTQKSNLTSLSSLRGNVMLDIDAACFDMSPIDLLPLIRYLARTGRANVRFGSTEGVVFHSIEAIVQQLNKLIPSHGNNDAWLQAVNGPMKRIDLHLFPHENIRAYYRFRGAEPMLRVVYPSAATEAWMKQSHKSGGDYEAYLEKTGLDALEMHIVVGHASRRTTNEGRMPLDWRLSYVGSRLSVEQAVRISGQWAR